MHRLDSELHVRGVARFVDDEPEPANLLHAVICGSPHAYGRINAVEIADAEKEEGVEAVLTFDDIPGAGFIGPIIQDEPLFAFDHVMYAQQPIAMVVARDVACARRATGKIKVSIDLLPVVTCPRKAYAQGLILEETRRSTKGDVEATWADCDVVIEGSVELGSQEHVYLETNRARAMPLDNGQIKVFSSTQNPAGVQRAVASILDIPFHLVEVDVTRIGGAFGGKEDQATHWACMAALAAVKLKRPVQIVLSRSEDMRMTGKRHPYEQDYKIGLRRDGKILAYQIQHYQNSGAFMDLSAPVSHRAVFHSTGAYAIENVCIEATACRTNLPPNTAFRGFGAPQAMFALEAAIYHAAKAIGLDPEQVQERNLLKDGYRFPYGQTIQDCTIVRSWNETKASYNLGDVRRRTQDFNNKHRGQKKGYALMPVCFGIGFTKTFLNQGSSLVHVHTDGSVSIASGGVEMGQGVNSNLVAIAARAFGIRPTRVHVNSTNTTRIANSSASAASSTTDINGFATIEACEKIQTGLKNLAAKRLGTSISAIDLADEYVTVDSEATALTWGELVTEAYESRIPLTATGYYAPTDIFADSKTGQGNPFRYYVCGTALIEVTVDCLRGTYHIDAVKLAHELGQPLVPEVDLGQIEGGVVQGIGWVTVEEVVFDESGHLCSDSLSTYKIPDAGSVPAEIKVRFFGEQDSKSGPFKSRAVGEPPLMYGIAAYFAIKRAIDAFRAQQGSSETSRMFDRSPMTPERVLLSLYPSETTSPSPSEFGILDDTSDSRLPDPLVPS